MALYLVLNQFRSARDGSSFNEGDLIESTQLDLASLQTGGLAAALYDAASMAAPLAAFKANPNRAPGDLIALLSNASSTAIAYLAAGFGGVHMEIDLEGLTGLANLGVGATQAECNVRAEALRTAALAHGAGVGSITTSGEHLAADTTNDAVLAAIPPASPATLLGVGGTYPTLFAGGETFNPTINGVALAVVFLVGDQSLAQVVARINTVAAAAGLGAVAAPVGGQLQISGVTIVIAAGTANATLGIGTGTTTTLSTCIALVNGLLAWIVAHNVASGVHFHNDPTVPTITVNPPVTLANLITDLNDLRLAFINHFSIGNTGFAGGGGATLAYVDQPGVRPVAGATDTLLVSDIGRAVVYTGVVTGIAVPDLSAAPITGLLSILLEYENAAAAPVLTPTGAGVTLRWPGGTGAFTPATNPGVGRSTVTSRDGKAWTVT